MGTLSGEATLSFLFLPSVFIGINSKRKGFAPVEADSFCKW